MRHFSPSIYRFPCRHRLIAILLLGAGHAIASPAHVLEPVDTSSPRATLTSFAFKTKDIWRLFRDEYRDSPDYAGYMDIESRAERILRTLDPSEVAPSVRVEVGHQAAVLLWKTLARIELPALEVIPDASAFDDTDGPVKWTIPHTDIAIARLTEGTRKGEFLFSPGTVERVQEFHERTRELPCLRDVPIEDTARSTAAGGWRCRASSDCPAGCGWSFSITPCGNGAPLPFC